MYKWLEADTAKASMWLPADGLMVYVYLLQSMVETYGRRYANGSLGGLTRLSGDRLLHPQPHQHLPDPTTISALTHLDAWAPHMEWQPWLQGFQN